MPVALGLLAALLAPGAPRAEDRPLVILFGGYGATEADMRLWERMAARDPVFGAHFAFEGIAYPKGVDGGVARAVAAGGDTIADVVRRVRLRAIEQRRTILVGHSSGAGLAVTAAAQLAALTPVKLISLDAGLNTDAPPPDTDPIEAVECWAAAGADRVSFGYQRAQTLCGDHFHVLQARGCATPICLHFFLVNRRAEPGLTFKRSREIRDGVSGGYRDLRVNLDWLERSR